MNVAFGVALRFLFTYGYNWCLNEVFHLKSILLFFVLVFFFL